MKAVMSVATAILLLGSSQRWAGADAAPVSAWEKRPAAEKTALDVELVAAKAAAGGDVVGDIEKLWTEMISPPGAFRSVTPAQLELVQFVSSANCNTLRLLVIYLVANAKPVDCPPCPDCPRGKPGYTYTYHSSSGYVPVSPGLGTFIVDTPGLVTFNYDPGGVVVAANRWMRAFKRGGRNRMRSLSLSQSQLALIGILLTLDCEKLRYITNYIIVNPAPAPGCPPCPECPPAVDGYTYTYVGAKGFVPVAVGSGRFTCIEPGLVQFNYNRPNRKKAAGDRPTRRPFASGR